MTLDAGLATVIAAGVAALGILANTALTMRQNRKLNETHKQVTVNHHSSTHPTVLDRIDDVRTVVLELGTELNHLRGDFNNHVSHSNSMDERLIKIELAKQAEHEVRLTQVESEVSRAD
jgi:hypothetical protein